MRYYSAATIARGSSSRFGIRREQLDERPPEREISIDELGKCAGMLRFYFQRMFHMIAGLPVGEYVRHRRLTRAACDLVNESARVIDIAFRRFHGDSPTEVRKKGGDLRVQPRNAFHLEYRIESHGRFEVVGYSLRTTTCDGRLDGLIAQARGEMFYGLCIMDALDSEEMTCAIAIEPADAGAGSPGDASGLEYRSFEIPASRWAKFESVGALPDAIQDVWKRFFTEWFPATDYKHSGGPELEVYFADHRCEVWIPLKT